MAKASENFVGSGDSGPDAMTSGRSPNTSERSNASTLAGAAISASRATFRKLKQNLFWAFAYNSLGVPVAAGVLYPMFGILLSPMLAAAAMSLSSVSEIGRAHV